MKNTLFILFLLFATTLYSQGLSGTYTCNSITYTDNENSENSGYYGSICASDFGLLVPGISV